MRGDPRLAPDMTEPQSDLFEMRRLESLSNTIFGVAMTLLAYDLPKANFQALPGWTDLFHLYSGRLGSLALSFIIAGVFSRLPELRVVFGDVSLHAARSLIVRGGVDGRS